MQITGIGHTETYWIITMVMATWLFICQNSTVHFTICKSCLSFIYFSFVESFNNSLMLYRSTITRAKGNVGVTEVTGTKIMITESFRLQKGVEWRSQVFWKRMVFIWFGNGKEWLWDRHTLCTVDHKICKTALLARGIIQSSGTETKRLPSFDSNWRLLQISKDSNL